MNFDKFSRIGWTKKEGVNRVSLNKYDLLARDEFVAQLRSVKAQTEFDDAGNIYGIISKGERDLVAIGSHMDSVPFGGRFDGMYGVIAGLQLLKNLSKSRKKNHIAVIDFTNEEGSRWQPDLLGSGLATGAFDRDFINRREDVDGMTFISALKSTIFFGSPNNRVERQEPTVYLELHIEQGPVLESEGYEIGIPVGVVANIIDSYEFAGSSNHAGTTPISYRKDSLIAAAEFIKEVNQQLKLYSDIVATVGEIINLPNAYNVIPGTTQLKVDIRGWDFSKLKEFSFKINRLAYQIAEVHGISMKYKRISLRDKTQFNKELIELIEKSCIRHGLKYKLMVSGATHDSVNMSKIARTAMVFVPSHRGISHSKDEFTKDVDLLNGYKVLKSTVALLNE